MKIAIYTDDAPIREELLAAGLSRINTRFFASIKENITTIVVTHQGRYFSKDDLDADLRSKIVFMNINQFFVKVIKKVTKKTEDLFGIDLDLLYRMFLPKILRTINESNSDYLFVPLGANIRGYRRAIDISEKTRLPLAVFIGDEFKNYAVLSENKNSIEMCDRYLYKWLHKTSKIFVISNGMKKFLAKQYDVESEVLNLPYRKKYDVKDDEKSNAVFFLGNASHFYQDGLVDMMDIICDYNAKHDSDVYMRFTIDRLPDIFEKHHMRYIKYGKIDTDYNSSREISEALFCFIPTSFDAKYRVMVSTSFPSKLMECLAFAKNIVVYGPEYSSSVDYFRQNNLKTCLSVKDKDKLFGILDDMIMSKDDYSKEYSQVIKDNHSLNYLKSTIMNNLR